MKTHLINKFKTTIMELVIEKSRKCFSQKRFFLLSILMCLFCLNCLVTKAASEVQVIQDTGIKTTSGSGLIENEDIAPGDSSEFYITETEVSQLSVPDIEADPGVENWMHTNFYWRSVESDMEIINSREADPLSNEILFFKDLDSPVNEQEPVLESWMLENMGSVTGADKEVLSGSLQY